jgi:hypothetical protein
MPSRVLCLVLLVAFATNGKSQAIPPTPTLANTLELHNHVEWRVNAQMHFDRQGRILILYRDNAKLNPAGNWHLIRFTDPLSGSPHREDLAFSIPQEPESPRASDTWNTFHNDLLLSPDETHAFAVFAGVRCKELPGSRPATGGYNVKCQFFSAAVTFDLTRFRSIANQDITDHLSGMEPWGRPAAVSPDGELLTLLYGKQDWEITVFSPQLEVSHVIQRDEDKKYWQVGTMCSITPQANLLCSSPSNPNAEGELSSCKPNGDPALVQGGFGIETHRSRELLVSSNAVCHIDAMSLVSSSGADLLPLCHQSWRLKGISPDRHSLIAECSEENNLLDIWYYASRRDIEIVDAATLRPTAYLKLSTRSRFTDAVFHSGNRTILATLKEAGTLKLYTIPDHSQH